jgi:AcrR family transcriptional regulator
MPEKPPSLRERQAQLTREEILKAARRLFAERGYARTSVRDIAEAAGVSAQTVYDSIGSKQSLVTRLNDLIDDEAGIAAIAATAARSGDPIQLAALPAAIARAILEHCSDIVHALVTGAAAEPDLGVALAEGQRRHVDGARMVVGQLQAMHALDESVDPEAAVDTLCAIADVRVALMLQEGYGWSLDRIETWIATTAQALLLGPGGASSTPRRR